MKKIGIFILFVALMLTSLNAAAEVKPGSFSVTPFTGWYFFEGNEDLKDTFSIGFRAGYNVTKNIGVEGFLHYVPTEIAAGDVDLYGYGIEGLYHFMPDSKFVPFLAAGLGGIHYRGPSGMGEKNKLSFDYGAGLKYFITDKIALRADIRHILPMNDRYNDLLLALGINFSFGGKEKEVVAPMVEAPAPPVITMTDSDNDSVPDHLDRCPGTPYGAAVDRDGCPVDSDDDGVPDYLDKCLGTPAGTVVDKDGCPPIVEEKKQTETVERVSISMNVTFDTAKAVIKKKYHNEIKKVADFMNDYPNTSVVIEGHTDNVDRFNNPENNIRLSQQRADSIRQYLIEKFGIDASRVTAVGYGPNRPIAGNDTEEGRKKNRRVEAVIETVK